MYCRHGGAVRGGGSALRMARRDGGAATRAHAVAAEQARQKERDRELVRFREAHKASEGEIAALRAVLGALPTPSLLALRRPTGTA